MKKLFTLIPLLTFGYLCIGQVVIMKEDFEDATVEYSTSVPEFTDGSEDYFIRTDGSNIASGVSFTGITGSFFFAAQDIDGEVASSQQTMTFTGIDISGFSNVMFSIDVAEDDDGANQDWDATDFVLIEVQVDAGGFTNLFAIQNDGSTFNTEPQEDTDFSGIGDGAAITDAFTTYTKAIAGTSRQSGLASTLDIRITIDLNGGDEDIAFDEITVTGMTILPVTYSFIQAENVRNSNLITWGTSSEVNNDFFEIQHSIDGHHFSSIGTVNAKGSSRAVGDYSFSHDAPSTGLHYYRLKQVDLDGTYALSDVKVVEVMDGDTFSVFPTTTQNMLEVRHSFSSDTNIDIVNHMGQVVLRNTGVLSTDRIDVSSLTPQLYFARLSSGDQVLSKKFIKQ